MTKEQETRVRILGALAALFMVCATALIIIVPDARWSNLGHFLKDPATIGLVTTFGGVLVSLYLRAKASPAT